jgi:hypothetical protein
MVFFICPRYGQISDSMFVGSLLSSILNSSRTAIVFYNRALCGDSPRRSVTPSRPLGCQPVSHQHRQRTHNENCELSVLPGERPEEEEEGAASTLGSPGIPLSTV